MPSISPSPDRETKAVNLRVRSDTRAIIDRGAALLGRTRSDFMIEAARVAAENVILDQTLISVDRETYDRFLMLLDAPPQSNGKLRELMQTKAPWETR
ncbi:DUF1778 domain-containing protein [Novosphingobium sp. BL-8H]|uniref:type II toxin-antitoxin system TacA family antitoxin n=1 Tax=Novosphingobium sp. BL-8H TaxID=3127640 RepID=UPI003757DE62